MGTPRISEGRVSSCYSASGLSVWITVIFRLLDPSRRKGGALWASLTWAPHLLLLLSSCVSLGKRRGWPGTEFPPSLITFPNLRAEQKWQKKLHVPSEIKQNKLWLASSWNWKEVYGWKQPYYLALPRVLRRCETWESFFFYCTNIYCVFTVFQPLCMESKCRHGPFGAVHGLPDSSTCTAWAMRNRHCGRLHVTGQGTEAESQEISGWCKEVESRVTLRQSGSKASAPCSEPVASPVLYQQ